MKGFITTIAIVLFSMSSFAFSSGLTPMAGDEDHGGEHQDKVHNCVHAGMDAAKTTDDQHKVIHGHMVAMMQAKKDHAQGLHEGMHAMKLAWSKHPVSTEEIMAAEALMNSHTSPIKAAVRDALIGVVNVLTVEQRPLFDHAFMTCMHSN